MKTQITLLSLFLITSCHAAEPTPVANNGPLAFALGFTQETEAESSFLNTNAILSR
ncbi:MAG: hypothetical protein ACI8W8_002053 [Rhodothermales bacterium]|jgi:hypothetical protein